MSEVKQIRWSGYGGQGVVLAGVLLGEAGVIDGKFVAGSNSYGAQARGSGCKSEIVFSNEPIDFPHLVTADIFVALSQGAYSMYCGDVRETSGFIIYDQGQVINPREELRIDKIGIPATEIALTQLKNKQVANIVLLGALIKITEIVSLPALQKAIFLHVSETFQTLNLKALALGLAVGGHVHG